MSTRHETTEAKLTWLRELAEEAGHAGTEKAIARHRERGKLLARERLHLLLDPGVTDEMVDLFLGDLKEVVGRILEGGSAEKGQIRYG